MGMSLADIKSIILAGFKSAFMPFHIKQSYLRKVSEELERFSPDGQIKPATAPAGSTLRPPAGGASRAGEAAN
jgi:adenosine deaminase